MPTSNSALAAKAALVEITIACAVIPGAWPVAQIVYFNQCDPEAMLDASQEWMQLYRELEVARQCLDQSVSAVSAEQWSGADRDAFGEHVQKYDVQIVGSQVVAVAVSVGLICVAVVLLVLIVAYALFSTILCAFAVFIAAAAASIIGAPAAASAEATANSIAATAVTMLKTIEAAAEGAAIGAAAAITGALAFDVGVQLGSGNTDVLKDLVQATVDGLDNVAVGFLSKLERDFVGHGIYNGGRHVAGSPYGPGSLMYGGTTQYGPTDDGYGTGGVVDNIWKRFFDEDAINN
ncbi:WXG100 family type VII secretion target [Micromonospora sp. SL1-18]|uniref:WXG100 family type VII secretion target n=1 Tax=Micromonospora sp. SL1-18 TaxID=3399128 RepID=UPI003A4D5485